MKIVQWFVVIVLGILLGLAGWYLGSSSREVKTIAPVVSEEDSRRVVELEQQINDMKKRLSALKEKQTIPDQEATATTANTQKLSAPHDSGENPPSSNNSPSQHTEDQPAPSMAADPVSAITSLPQKFASEEIDTKWALDHEKKLQEALYKAPEFQAMELGSITCRSTICEIKIKVYKKDNLIKLGSTLNRLLMNKQPNVFDPNMMIKYSESEKTGSFYFGGIN